MSIGERLYAAYNAGDAEAAASLYAANGANTEVASGRTAVGRDAIRDGLAGFLTAIPDARWESERRLVAATGEAIAYRLTGTLAGRLGPFEPRGQRLDLRGVHLLTVADEAIVASADYYDTGSLAAQLEASK